MYNMETSTLTTASFLNTTAFPITKSFSANTTENLTVTRESTYSKSDKVASAIDLYVPPCLFCIGLVCNTLVIIVMGTRYFEKVSTSLYIRLNALLDEISLAIALPFHWVHVNFPSIIYRGPNSDILCKCLNFVGWGSSDLGVALTVAMTLERALATKFPLQAPKLCTVRRAKLTTLGLCLIIFAKDWQFLIMSIMTSADTRTHLCDLKRETEAIAYYVDKVNPMIHNIFLLLSFVIISVSNVIIINSVKKSQDFLGKEKTAPSTAQTRSIRGAFYRQYRSTIRKERQITIMLISDSITIVICTFPFAFYTAFSSNLEFANAGDERLMFSISFYLLYVNRCANFFLYCVSGERFRQSLKKLLSCSDMNTSTTSVYTLSQGTQSTQSQAQKRDSLAV